MAKRTRYPGRTAGKGPARRAARPDSPALPAVRETGSGQARGGDEHPPYPHEHLEDGTIVASRGGLTQAEVERAAELEAEATAKEKAAIAESLRRRNRAQADDHHATGDVNAPLSVRAAHEYAYVSRDVKRIALTGGLMIAILAVLHVLVNVMGVISL